METITSTSFTITEIVHKFFSFQQVKTGVCPLLASPIVVKKFTGNPAVIGLSRTGLHFPSCNHNNFNVAVFEPAKLGLLIEGICFNFISKHLYE